MGSILTKPYDLIFLDYFLATSIAPDFIRTLRDGGCEIPIVVLSAKEFDKRMLTKVNESGGNRTYLKKKFNEKTIEFIIHAHLDITLFLPPEGQKSRELSQLSILYEDGRLIQNYGVENGKLRREESGHPRPHLFASSLVAVDQFLQEAAESASPFREMQTEDITLMMERGRWIAVSVITKTPNQYIRYRVHKMIVEIENKYKDILDNWNGNMSLLDMDPFIAELQLYTIN